MRRIGPTRFRFRGNPELARRFLAEGRKHLGVLEDRLGTTPNGARRLKNAAGVKFTVARIGGQHFVDIDVTALAPRQIEIPALFGFVTKPRRFGVEFDPFPIDTTNGENAYGEKAHVLLRDAAPTAEDAVWRQRYFDATYLPDGQELLYGGTFPDGLLNVGNVDWRDGAEKLSVTWIGAPCRSIATPAMFQGYVFHNGRVVLDVWDSIGADAPIDASRAINCACLKQVGTDLYLYWLAVPFSATAGTLRLCRAKLRALPASGWPLDTAYLAPQLDQVLLADVEELYVLDNTADIDNAFGCTQGAFNQAATEVRVIYQSWSASGDDESLHCDELRIDFSDADDITHSSTRHTVSVTRTTTYGLHTYQPNRWQDTEVDWPADTAGSLPRLETGIAMTPNDILSDTGWDGENDPNDDNYRAVVVTGGSASVSVVRTGGPVPIAIDFKDDVPVRLWWQPGEATASASLTRTFAGTNERSGTRDNYYNSVGSRAEAARDVEHHVTFNATYSATGAQSNTGGEIYVLVEGGEPWLELAWSMIETSSTTGTDARTADQAANGSQATGETMFTEIPSSDITITQAECHVDFTGSTTASRDVVNHAVLFLDMRYDSATTLTETVAYDETVDRIVDGDFVSIDPTPGPTNPYEWNAPGIITDADFTDTSTGSFVRTWALSVVFAGTEVFADTLTDTVSLAGSNVFTARQDAIPAINVGTYFDIPVPGLAGNPVAGDIASGPSGASVYVPSESEASTLYTAIVGSPADVALVYDDTTDTPATVVGDAEFGEFPEHTSIAWAPTSVSSLFWGDANILFGNYWMFRYPDTDIRSDTNLALPKAYGTWIAYRERWAYSLPWPASVATIDTPRWIHGIAPDDAASTLFDLTGERTLPATPDLYGTMWPLSTCIARLPAGITVQDLLTL